MNIERVQQLWQQQLLELNGKYYCKMKIKNVHSFVVELITEVVVLDPLKVLLDAFEKRKKNKVCIIDSYLQADVVVEKRPVCVRESDTSIATAATTSIATMTEIVTAITFN